MHAFALLSQAAPSVAAPASVLWAYAGFLAVIIFFLALDLGVFHRAAHIVTAKEAIAWTIVWVCVAMLFNAGLYFLYNSHTFGLGLNVPVLGEPGVTTTLSGTQAAKNFFVGYVVEKSLSLDNVFIIAVIFASLGIPAMYQHRVLFWGILGALVMRGGMIFAGAALIERFSWIIYVFGGVLILTAVKMALVKGDHKDPAASPVVRLAKRLFPFSDSLDGQRFFTRAGARRVATPLFLALVLVEFTDLVFAIDSIPAIYAITADPFLVLTSNIFAILGLRSLYFALAAMIRGLRYLKPALIAVLAFIGVKMCLIHTPYKIPSDAALYTVFGLLACGIAASLLTRPAPNFPSSSSSS